MTQNPRSQMASPAAVSTAARRAWPARHPFWFTFLVSLVVVWGAGLAVYILIIPYSAYNAFKNGILVQGGGNGPIPVNTLYTESQALFADPLHPPASASKLLTTGVNRDTLLTMGWLDLSQGPLVLHVPAMPDRYYAVQFTDPSGTDFGYVGTRATGSDAGDYLISGPGYQGTVPQGLAGQIASPDNSVLVIGRVLVESDSDLPTAYDLSTQITLTPLSRWQPGP